MKTEDDGYNMTQSCNPLSKLTWLIAGVGIGAAAGILLLRSPGKTRVNGFRVNTKTD